MAEEDVQKVEIQNKEEMAKSIAETITNQQQSTFNALSQSTTSITESSTTEQTNTIIDSVDSMTEGIVAAYIAAATQTKSIVNTIQEASQSTTDSINSMMDTQTEGASAGKVVALENKREGERTSETRHSEFLDAINGIKLVVAPKVHPLLLEQLLILFR